MRSSMKFPQHRTFILTYLHHGETHMINEALIVKQGLTFEEAHKVKELQKERLNIEDKINQALKQGRLGIAQAYCKVWTENEFELQRTWKFPVDARFHRFWTIPGCKCPSMDNQDRYPLGDYVVNSSCPLHGFGEKR